MSLAIEQLNKNFSFKNGDNTLFFRTGQGGIPFIEINNKQAKATISLQGAHLLDWTPVGEDGVIWLSEEATFAPGKAIRGGIPVCWPWFGTHQNCASFPAHGLARTVLWQVTGTQQLSTGETQINFRLEVNPLDEQCQRMWPLATVVEYRITIAKTLRLELTTINNSHQSITIGQALHSYFNVDDITGTTVSGLEGKDYLDKTDNYKRKTQTGAIVINEEVDRVYLNTSDDAIIENKKRKIIIKKRGSQSTVVWNPWKDVAEKMGDMDKAGYLGMLCVESANVAEDVIRIKAGESHTLAVIYKVEKTG